MARYTKRIAINDSLETLAHQIEDLKRQGFDRVEKVQEGIYNFLVVSRPSIEAIVRDMCIEYIREGRRDMPNTLFLTRDARYQLMEEHMERCYHMMAPTTVGKKEKFQGQYGELDIVLVLEEMEGMKQGTLVKNLS